ncbi:MAG: hypothetical protein ABF780_05815 [Bifidobacterium aquikefiri]|uniref:Uncharacterized protein n=1 Tax=Bifidobacterium aquikefiri TaxID=1653207 RepID=A0A261G252_9BIFI|nr:hypothetical protein [Bifidobacterium aquikefiri]OZG65519.1 hypothetical protein BAQU_1702 [Bifidobacterium aquikefiri]
MKNQENGERSWGSSELIYHKPSPIVKIISDSIHSLAGKLERLSRILNDSGFIEGLETDRSPDDRENRQSTVRERLEMLDGPGSHPEPLENIEDIVNAFYKFPRAAGATSKEKAIHK